VQRLGRPKEFPAVLNTWYQKIDQTTTSTPESELKAADFAIQTEHAAMGKLGRTRSLRKRTKFIEL
jgi:hypothetical protein